MPRFSFAALLAVLALLAVAASASAATNQWLKPRPLNIAHQGGEDEFPSNTMYAFKRAVKAGADMLELDIGVTKDNQVVVIHDTTVDRTSNGSGLVSRKTLAQLRRLDGAYWFSAGDDAYRHDRRASAYRFRGIATGRKPPPRGYRESDFHFATLREVLKAFPRVPINIEIKGRTKAEATAEYVRNAEVLASLLRTVSRRDIIVVSFKQEAVDRFHVLQPSFDLAPGIAGGARYLFQGGSAGEGVKALQVPLTFDFSGNVLQIATPANVAKAHRDGIAWQSWFSGTDSDSAPTWRKLIDLCVDGVMTARPVAFERVLRSYQRTGACPS